METLDKKLQGLQLIAQEKLQAIICSIPGKKDLILEKTLIKPLEHVCAASWLKLKGIQRIYKFEPENIIPRTLEHQVHVYMIRSRLETFQRVLGHIHELEQQQPTDLDAAVKNFHIICVPSCFSYFQDLLEAEGLYGLVQLHRYNWDFVYLDQGAVMSLEIPNVFSTAFLQEDTSLLPAIAQSLRVLQMVCGRPELVLTFGDHAANIMKILKTLGAWSKSNVATEESDFSVMLIIDRDKDYASSLLTPAIYAGLLLEVFNNRAGEIEIETETNKILRQKVQIFLPPKETKQPAKKASDKPEKVVPNKPSIIRLNSHNDEIYGDNRYKHFAQASSLVRAQAKAIGLEVHKLNDMKLDEMHDYVARKLPKITELKTKVMRHLNASERVIEMLAGNFRRVQSLEEDILNNVARKRILVEIDELLTTDGQQYNTLRLMCLLHLCAGISAEELVQFARNYCNYFGSQHLHVFQQLAKAGLLPTLHEEERLNKSQKLLSNLPLPKFQQTEFQANANRLKLMVSSADNEGQASGGAAGNSGNNGGGGGACPSYVFNNLYIPIAAQLCSFLLKATNADDFAAKVGMVDKMQMHALNSSSQSATVSVATPVGAKSFASSVKQGATRDIFPLRKRNIFVYVVGGMTYAEIGACDLVSRLTGAHIVCASDAIVAGSDLIGQAF